MLLSYSRMQSSIEFKVEKRLSTPVLRFRCSARLYMRDYRANPRATRSRTLPLILSVVQPLQSEARSMCLCKLLISKLLTFSLLIGTDIHCPHAANLSLGDAISVQLTARVFDVCFEQRVDLKTIF